MIEIHALTAVLGTEFLLVLLAGLVYLLWRSRRTNRREQASAGALVEKVNAEMDARLDHLGGRLFNSLANLSEDARRQSVLAVAVKENELYRHVIRAFLDRDASKLAQLDVYVQGVSEPYLQLIADLIEHLQAQARLPEEAVREWEGRLAAAEAAGTEARSKAERINRQLALALNILDEVSSEYAKMFNETTSAEELQNSRSRMLAAFGRTERDAVAEILPALPDSDSRDEP